MHPALIVAMSENGVIGKDGDLPWHLSEDLKRFKRLTTGHHIIMGRKTWDSIGRLLPGRTTVILTRQEDFAVEGALIAGTVEQAIAMCAGDDSPFITGGAEIYRQSVDLVQTLHITRVHAEVDGDTRFPEVDWQQWELSGREEFEPGSDSKCPFGWTFETWTRKPASSA